MRNWLEAVACLLMLRNVTGERQAGTIRRGLTEKFVHGNNVAGPHILQRRAYAREIITQAYIEIDSLQESTQLTLSFDQN